MSPETKKEILIGGIIVAAGIILVVLYKKAGSGGSAAQGAAAQAAQDQADYAALLALQGSGQNNFPSVGLNVAAGPSSADLATEVASLLKSAGVANPESPASNPPVNAPAPPPNGTSTAIPSAITVPSGAMPTAHIAAPSSSPVPQTTFSTPPTETVIPVEKLQSLGGFPYQEGLPVA